MKKILFIAIMFCVTVMAFSQSADKITEILDAQEISFSQAAYLSQTLIDDSILEEDAFNNLKRNNVIGQKKSETDSVTMQDFANICANTWDIKGSLFLMAFKNGRYAFRQMRVDGVIPKDTDPSAILSGRDALNIITNCLDVYQLKGGAQ